MNSHKQRELLTAGLEDLLRTSSTIGSDYDALACMLEDTPASLFLAWIVIELEAHRNIIMNMVRCLRDSAQAESMQRAHDVEIQSKAVLCWVNRLKAQEHAIVTACHTLKTHTSGVQEALVDGLLDALVLDSQKHRGLLAAVENNIEKMMMQRPQ